MNINMNIILLILYLYKYTFVDIFYPPGRPFKKEQQHLPAVAVGHDL